MLHRRLKIAMLVALVAAIFVLDTETGYDVAASGCYTIVVLVAVALFNARGVVLLTTTCAALIPISFVVSHKGGDLNTGIANMGVCIMALAATTFLALRIVAAEAAAREAQAHVARLTRVTSLGALTASIAHEINQPLTAVIASGDAGLRWLGQSPPRLDRAEAAFGRIVADARRAGDIIDNLRLLARGELPHKAVIDLNAVIVQQASLVRGAFERAQVDLERSLPDPPVLILADAVQVQQVMHNLLLNALDAVSERRGKGPRRVTVSVEVMQDDAVVTVADLGVGFPPGNREQPFDAFWTTKAHGIGMGLTICRSIVEAHGGTIHTGPNQPRGARVTFTLPAVGKDQP